MGRGRDARGRQIRKRWAACCSASKKQEVLRLLPFPFPNRTDRGAIRPHFNRNIIGVRKDIASHKTASFLSSGLNTPLFFHTLHRSRM